MRLLSIRTIRKSHFWIGLIFALISLGSTGGLMRKNDQAMILSGALDIARGAMREPTAYYQMDKTPVLYGACAAVALLVPGERVIAAANLSLAAFFWASLLLLVVRFRSKLDPVVLLCVITSPAIIFNTQYVNSSVLSSAWLLLAALFLFRTGFVPALLSSFFFALAVASRADIILLLPLLCYLLIPSEQIEQFWKQRRDDSFGSAISGFRRGLLKPGLLILFGSGSILVGRRFFGAGSMDFDPFFQLKMAAGYWVFGFGAAGFLFLGIVVAMVCQSIRSTPFFMKLYRVGGLLAFLLPVLFFMPQLHTPRYFWRGCEAILLVTVSDRIPLRMPRSLRAALLILTLLPLAFGIRIVNWPYPQISVTKPSLYPTGDGLYPMGATLPFLFRLNAAIDTPLDHNQRVWFAAREARLEPDEDGMVPVLATPMSGYLQLAAALRHLHVNRICTGKIYPDDPIMFYADSRSLMRHNPKSPIRNTDLLLQQPARFVSPQYQGVGILRFDKEGDKAWGRQTNLLNRLFLGDEYSVTESVQGERISSRTVLFSPHPFGTAAFDEESEFFYQVGSAPECTPDVKRADPVLPAWMSVQSFQ